MEEGAAGTFSAFFLKSTMESLGRGGVEPSTLFHRLALSGECCRVIFVLAIMFTGSMQSLCKEIQTWSSSPAPQNRMFTFDEIFTTRFLMVMIDNAQQLDLEFHH